MWIPDIEIFIDIPAEESMSRKGKHNNGENDRYESDLGLLERVRELFIARDNIKINGMQSPKEVHEDIVASLLDVTNRTLSRIYPPWTPPAFRK
jgi:dTMP kinase